MYWQTRTDYFVTLLLIIIFTFWRKPMTKGAWLRSAPCVFYVNHNVLQTQFFAERLAFMCLLPFLHARHSAIPKPSILTRTVDSLMLIFLAVIVGDTYKWDWGSNNITSLSGPTTPWTMKGWARHTRQDDSWTWSHLVNQSSARFHGCRWEYGGHKHLSHGWLCQCCSQLHHFR